MKKTNTQYMLMETKLGWIGAAAADKGLAAVVLPQPTKDQCLARLNAYFQRLEDKDNLVLNQFRSLAIQYFSGKAVDFGGLLLDISWATPFQAKVFKVVRGIPFGSLMTYKEVANVLGYAKGFQAVGGALSRNRLPLVIPCHRVTATGGGLGGFTGTELEVKRALILNEKACDTN